MPDTIQCTQQHIEPLARVLAKAFEQDPFYEYVFPEPDTREALAFWEMQGLLRYGLRFGEVVAPPNLIGCSVWLPPGLTDFTEARMAEAEMLSLTEYIGQEANDRLDLFNEATEAVHQRLLPGPHWYLLLLGIEPAFQGQRIGSRLILPLLTKADQDSLPIYLETTNPRNPPFYEKHGFEVRVQEPLCANGPIIWYMVREPKSPHLRGSSG